MADLAVTSQSVVRQDQGRPGLAQTNATRLGWLLMALGVLLAV